MALDNGLQLPTEDLRPAKRPAIAKSFHDARLPDLAESASPVPYMTRLDKVAAGLGAFILIAPLAAAAFGSYFV